MVIFHALFLSLSHDRHPTVALAGQVSYRWATGVDVRSIHICIHWNNCGAFFFLSFFSLS